MFPFSRSFVFAVVLGAGAAPLSAQTPQILTTPVPGHLIELHFDVAPFSVALTPPPPLPTRAVPEFGTTCSMPVEGMDTSNDTTMVVRHDGSGIPPVPMPGAGRSCHDTFGMTWRTP